MLEWDREHVNIINSHACTCRHFSSSLRLPYIRTHSATHTLHTLNGSCSISHVRCAARSLCDFISLSLSVSFGSLIHGALGMLFESCMSVFYMTNAETVFSFVATDVWHCCPLLLVYFLSVFLVVHVIYYIYFFLLLLPVLFLVLLLSLLSSIYSYFLCHSSVHLYEWSSKNSCLCKRDFRVLTKVCGFYSICLSSNHCIDHLMVRIFM